MGPGIRMKFFSRNHGLLKSGVKVRIGADSDTGQNGSTKHLGVRLGKADNGFTQYIGNNLIPFFIEHSQLHKSSLLRVQFEDVYDEATENAMIGTELFLPLSFLPPLEGNKFYYHEIIGFKVTDISFGDVGVLVGVNDKTAQHLFVIENQGKEILIPINDLFIKQVDRENKILGLDVPQGLIELYR